MVFYIRAHHQIALKSNCKRNATSPGFVTLKTCTRTSSPRTQYLDLLRSRGTRRCARTSKRRSLTTVQAQHTFPVAQLDPEFLRKNRNYM